MSEIEVEIVEITDEIEEENFVTMLEIVLEELEIDAQLAES